MDCIVKRDTREREFRETNFTTNLQARFAKIFHCSSFSIICLLKTSHQCVSSPIIITGLSFYRWVFVCLPIYFFVYQTAFPLFILPFSVCPRFTALYLHLTYKSPEQLIYRLHVYPSICVCLSIHRYEACSVPMRKKVSF